MRRARARRNDHGRAFHRAEDGTDTDITQGVQALYDLVISSMNWGSGFWSWEDALPVARSGTCSASPRSRR